MANFCSECGAPLPGTANRFCPNCGKPLAGNQLQPRQTSVLAPNSQSRTPAPFQDRTGRSTVETAVTKYRQDLYGVREAANAGGVVWEVVGKHVAALWARFEAAVMRRDLEVQLKEGYRKLHQQFVDAQTERQRRHLEDEILREVLERRTAILMDELGKIATSFQALPEPIQEEVMPVVIERMTELILDFTLKIQQEAAPGTRATLILNGDEF